MTSIMAGSMTETGRTRLGFVGCGFLAESVVRSLVKRRGDRLSILVSPRSETVSRKLAAEHACVRRAACNDEVIEGTDIVFLAMRPQQLREALGGTIFRAGQTVASFLAKTTIADLQALVGPAARLCRVTPLPSIALCKGPICFYPGFDDVVPLFEGLGDPLIARDEAEIMALGYASGLLSTYFEFQNTIVEWLMREGAGEQNAGLYVRSMLEGLAATGRAAAATELGELPARHETQAGLNERSRLRLRKLGWFDEIGRTLDMLDRRTSLAPPQNGNEGRES